MEANGIKNILGLIIYQYSVYNNEAGGKYLVNLDPHFENRDVLKLLV